MDGFRDGSKAPPGLLVAPVLDAIECGFDSLAGAVLNLWATSESELRDEVLRELENAAIATGGEIADGGFDGAWPFADWLDRRDDLAERLPDANPDAIGLMLAVTANRLPTPPAPPRLETPRFLDWLDELYELDPEAPEWDEAGDFALYLLMLGDDKIEERREAAFGARDAAVLRLAEEYANELGYLGIDLMAWLDDSVRDPAQTVRLTGELETALALYRPVRPQGVTLAEETERAGRRAELEASVLAIPPLWEALPQDLDAEPEPEETEDAPPKDEKAQPKPRELAEMRRAYRQARADCDRLRVEAAELQAERDLLTDANASLRLAKEQLDEENGRLRGELDRARSTEEDWRKAYVEARRARVAQHGRATEIAGVAEALELAARSFPDALAISLNAKSDPDVPFAKPAEVFDALAWLATAYRRRGAPGIEESCPGWFHKPDQSQVTVGKYPEWYRTSFEGRTIAATNHIGKGTSFDPRSTIRIGFAWDEETQRVVVGYVGRHQRNRKS
ncbi:MAG: hypothetical protein OXI64_01445 [Defluviicoccus sp.]|nr:hypothetical protein [Defluviicoccus sp.]